jgi:hypothetical protein
MDYATIYLALMERAARRKLEGYKEKHHIVPRCMGGTNDVNNIVELTAREHYLAHLLLVKIHPDNRRLIYAASMMCSSPDRLKRTNNRQYEWLKIRRATAMSILHAGKVLSEETKQKLREKNRNYRPTADAKERSRLAHIGRVVSEETRAKISAAARGHSRTKGRVLSEDHKRKLSLANKGRRLSPETKAKLSAANQGKKGSNEKRAKLSLAKKGKPLSQQHRASLSAARKGKPARHGWITDGINNQLVLKTDPIPSGWRKGRFNPPTGPRNRSSVNGADTG